MRFLEVKITAPLRSDKNFKEEERIASTRAEGAGNDDQQSSFLNISRITIHCHTGTVNAYREAGSLSSNASMS
jgi:hypothetical protein